MLMYLLSPIYSYANIDLKRTFDDAYVPPIYSYARLELP